MQKETITLPNGTKVEALAPVIVSASRSTDIPAFYARWFIERLKAGYVVWINPFNRQPSYVTFRKTRVIVFWTKNPKPLLPYLEELDKRGINYYFQFTLNDYDKEGFEPNVPTVAKRVETFRALSQRLGSDRVIWRFDPIIITPTITPEVILHKISLVSKKLQGLTNKLVFSFIDVQAYKKVQHNLITASLFTKENVLSAEATKTQREIIARGLVTLRQYWADHGWNFDIATCAEKDDFSPFGINKNRCIDPVVMEKCFSSDQSLMHYLDGFRKQEQIQTDLFALATDPESSNDCFNYRKFKDKGQRPECGCVESKDIGMYDTCAHNCVYCYANTSPLTVQNNRKNFLLMSESIIPFKDTTL